MSETSPRSHHKEERDDRDKGRDGRVKRRERSRSRDRERRRYRSRSRDRGSTPKDRPDTRSRNDRRRSRSRDRDTHRDQRRRENDRGQNNKVSERVEERERKPQVEGKAGGVYIPPFRLAQMQREISDKSSTEYQKMTWEALKKSINGLINKVSVGNIQHLIPEIFYENLIRGRGLLARSMMKAQAASASFTPVYAALLAVINTKMPEIGELIIKRLIVQFRKAYSRNNKAVCIASTQFLAHLVNQQIAGVVIPLQICTLLLEKPTDDSVEVAVALITECGAILQELSPQGFNGIFDRFRAILHEGEIDKRVQYTIEMLFAVRKTNFAAHPAVKPELDLVELEDQITHDEIYLDSELDTEERLNFFHFDENFAENEEKYAQIRREILGDDVVEELEGRNSDLPPDENDDDEEREQDDGDEESARIPVQQQAVDKSGNMIIQDQTETDLINLRRTIYLTIMSSVDFNECAHKLMKVKLAPGQEMELCNMLIECCSQERTYMRFYGLLGARFCAMNREYQEAFDQCFLGQYTTIHRLETNKLRNVAKFFSHLLHSDALPWTVLQYIHLNEDETTSSSRIFIKIVFQELAEYLSLPKLNQRLKDPNMQMYYGGILPKDDPKNTRFAINFFTSIGLGGLTDDLREYLRNAPKRIVEQKEESESESESSDSDSSDSDSSSSDSDSDSDSSSDSSSDSEDDRKRRRR